MQHYRSSVPFSINTINFPPLTFAINTHESWFAHATETKILVMTPNAFRSIFAKIYGTVLKKEKESLFFIFQMPRYAKYHRIP